MGVTKNNGNPYGFQLMEDQLQVIEGYMAGDNLSQPVEEALNPADPIPKPSKKSKKIGNRLHQRDVRSPKKCCGVRNMRRYENLTYLLNMVEGEEESSEVASVDMVELVEPGISAFAELFKETEKMKIWNDFINRTEEEQQRILQSSSWFPPSESESLGSPQKVMERQDSWEMIGDKRTVHPAFSAEESFKRIDQNLRQILRKRHVPMGALCQLEEEVTTFFQEWPSSIYISQLSSSFERMLLHALCQYLGLISKSFDDDRGKRQTHVENTSDQFLPPALSLSQYLEHRDGKH